MTARRSLDVATFAPNHPFTTRMARLGGYRRATGRIALAATTALLAGCASYVDPSVPVAIRPVVEPEFQQRYLLYRPSSYDRSMAWPLVIICPAGFPDSPDQQIRDWTQLAERHGFLVCAPQVRSNAEGLFADTAKTIAALQDDERRILAMIRHIEAAYTISKDRVFLYGWASGALPAIYTGLRHPESFRAVAVIQPRVNVAALADARRGIDSSQPVLVYSNAADALWGHPAQECVEWLQEAGVDVKNDPMGPARRSDCVRAVDFFDHVIRSRPWIQVVVSSPEPTKPTAFHFAVQASFKPSKLRWRFGDGDEADVAEPIHVFSKPGSYRVSVELVDSDGRTHERTTEVNVRTYGGG